MNGLLMLHQGSRSGTKYGVPDDRRRTAESWRNFAAKLLFCKVSMLEGSLIHNTPPFLSLRLYLHIFSFDKYGFLTIL